MARFDYDVRSALFFDGARIAGPILVLVVWAALGAALAIALGGRIMNPADTEARGRGGSGGVSVLVIRIVSSLAQRSAVCVLRLAVRGERSAVSVQRSARVGKHRITAAPQRTRCEFCSHVRQDSQTPRRALRELRNLLTAGCTGIRV